MTVPPAAYMASDIGRKEWGNLVIVNIQKTPYDDLAKLRIFGFCDQVMELLFKKLGMNIPDF